jgi:hypothetical protein
MTLSTTSPGDEREAFDRWHISKWRDVIDFNGIPNAWDAWQARAALSSSTVQQVGADALDAARFAWYFSFDPAIHKSQEFMRAYMEGMRDCWSLDQWRAAIDAAMASQGDQQ